MNYLSRDDLLDLHAFAIARYGGRMGIASQDRLLSLIDAPRQKMFGAELYPTIPSKAAALTFLLIKNRPFVSGNEITALLALLRFLLQNGMALRPDVAEGQLNDLVRSIQQSRVNREDLEAWLHEYIEEVPV
jgi:death-on-curing protein